MATSSHTIYSHYDPEERLLLEYETGQISHIPGDPAGEWQVEANVAFPKAILPPPVFVPAKHSDTTRRAGDDIPERTHFSIDVLQEESPDSISGWYKSLERTAPPLDSIPCIAPAPKPQPTPRPAVVRKRKRDKNDWFISNALESSSNSMPVVSPGLPPRSLHDMLATDPPPRPTEPKFHPPVWLAIGPSNKGFAMLQSRGWNEGEPLGKDVQRNTRASPPSFSTGESAEDTSDSDSPDEADSQTDSPRGHADETLTRAEEAGIQKNVDLPPDPYSDRKALVTPIPTVLKADRLGIGLKAKTHGPYRASVKRITHGSQAIAAHIRTTEDLRRKQHLYGRGRRGFARQHQKQEASRRSLIAYLNS